MSYEVQDLVRIAKRHHNTKRTYLLVNPLQGKHIPVSPSASLEMMGSLGEKLRQRFPSARLVIGFAETATAIGAVAAGCISPDCVYIHTTRELLDDRQCLYFQEEHSHATDQTLCGDRLRACLNATPQVIFVDDELSTGKTLLNIIDQLRRALPELQGKQLVAASIVNRLSPENETRLLEAGVVCEPLLRLPQEDYTSYVSQFETTAAIDCRGAELPPVDLQTRQVRLDSDSPRTGVRIGSYLGACGELIRGVMPWIQERLRPHGQILVLGTEEFMYPALALAKAIEELNCTASTVFHATTRSPIAVCGHPNYPIFNGCRLDSFYEAGRDTYIYDLRRYDTAVIFSESGQNSLSAVRSLASALYQNGCSHILYLSGGDYVQLLST